MSAAAECILPLPCPSVRLPPVLGSVFLPKEHGSWSLALEPLALGLLVAPSWGGGALAAAALAGFFARRPLKTVLAPTPASRRRSAQLALALFTAGAVVAGVEVLVLAPWSALWPLLPVAALGMAFTRFDAQGESRAAAAEVAGSAAFAILPAAFAMLAGRPGATALALAVLTLARSVPAVLVVRTCLRRAKGAFAARSVPLQASVAALAATLALVILVLAPAAAVLLGAILLCRALWLPPGPPRDSPTFDPHQGPSSPVSLTCLPSTLPP